MYVTQNAVCNCEIKSILTYLLNVLQYIYRNLKHVWIPTAYVLPDS